MKITPCPACDGARTLTATCGGAVVACVDCGHRVDLATDRLAAAWEAYRTAPPPTYELSPAAVTRAQLRDEWTSAWQDAVTAHPDVVTL